MQTYLVGGAVRDKLLGDHVNERDWVVVGATPGDLIALNYKPVGRDFPVFLHPKTKEEYALARTERKQSKGYYGFSCDFNPNISLTDDLLRRDLTINAIAMDQNHNLIDPYNGCIDLHKRILRHVSAAFIEDPVRVLRIARFMSRFGHLGFKIATETQELMLNMAQNDELEYLVPERVWQEWYKSLNYQNPELFIITLLNCMALKIIAPELNTELSVNHAALEILKITSTLSNDALIRFAALMYHLSVEQIKSLSSRLKIPNKYLQLSLTVSKFNHKINAIYNLSTEEIINVLEQSDAFRRPEIFNQLLIICDAIMIYQKKNVYSSIWRHILNACKIVKPNNLEITGMLIKQDIHNQRIEITHEIMKKYKAPNEK